MENVKIVKATSADADQLQKIASETFIEAFSAVNTEENMKHYLEQNLSLNKLTEEINNQGSTFYFAVFEDTTIGYLKINTGNAQTELKDDLALEIERIYVMKAYYGKGVANMLYDQAIATAFEINANYVWLGVWEENPRAISFYTKNGFVPFDKHIFKLGSDIQTDIMMKKNL